MHCVSPLLYCSEASCHFAKHYLRLAPPMICASRPPPCIEPRWFTKNFFLWPPSGRARARLITPLGASNLGRLTAGDAFVVPAGFVFGAHNDGHDKFRLLGVTNLAGTRGEEGKNITVGLLRRRFRRITARGFRKYGAAEGDGLSKSESGKAMDFLARPWT